MRCVVLVEAIRSRICRHPTAADCEAPRLPAWNRMAVHLLGNACARRRRRNRWRRNPVLPIHQDAALANAIHEAADDGAVHTAVADRDGKSTDRRNKVAGLNVNARGKIDFDSSVAQLPPAF